MAKDWKRYKDIECVDAHVRDSACLIWNGVLILGREGQSHGMIVAEIFGTLEDLTDINIEDYEKLPSYLRESIDTYDIEDTEVVFGNVKDKNIYWELYEECDYSIVKRISSANKDYNHFTISEDKKYRKVE